MHLERDLRQALARKDPPEGFEGRVASRIAARVPPAAAPAAHRAPRAWAALAASVLIVLGAGSYLREDHARRERARQQQAERTARDLVHALRIASDEVIAVRTKMEEVGR